MATTRRRLSSAPLNPAARAPPAPHQASCVPLTSIECYCHMAPSCSFCTALHTGSQPACHSGYDGRLALACPRALVSIGGHRGHHARQVLRILVPLPLPVECSRATRATKFRHLLPQSLEVDYLGCPLRYRFACATTFSKGVFGGFWGYGTGCQQKRVHSTRAAGDLAGMGCGKEGGCQEQQQQQPA